MGSFHECCEMGYAMLCKEGIFLLRKEDVLKEKFYSAVGEWILCWSDV